MNMIKLRHHTQKRPERWEFGYDQHFVAYDGIVEVPADDTTHQLMLYRRGYNHTPTGEFIPNIFELASEVARQQSVQQEIQEVAAPKQKSKRAAATN